MAGNPKGQVNGPFTEESRAELFKCAGLNSAGYDPWGLNLETTERTAKAVMWFYKHYFRVETTGVDKIPRGRVLLVPNHGGQLPLDGMLIALALLTDPKQPRLVRGMVERWFPALPFVGTLFVRCGQVVGDPDNCRELLARDQAIMVFPEGVRGSGKTIWNHYRLQDFGTGFVRLALENKAPIVPVAVVGSEETYPSVMNLSWLARLLGTPYVPVTPFFPLLGPLGMLPLPVKIQIHFGDPIWFDSDPDQPDDEVQEKVDLVKTRIQSMLDEGLEQRPGLRVLNKLLGR